MDTPTPNNPKSKTSNRKLIEVALPLDDINAASAREKSIRHGHPSTLHLWWARRPLAACRAVLFASLIDDPDQEGVPAELLKEIDALPAPELPDWRELPLAEQRRQRLFRFIKLLVQWESSNDERVLATARRLIHAATGGNPPPVYDPFAGGGSIPLEAQRLGLEAHASDLNPVAVLINKALIEIPPKFAGMPPVNPESRKKEIGNSGGADALQGAHRVAEGDGDGSGSLSPGSAPASRGDLRDALSNHTGSGVDPSQYRRGLGARVGAGEGAVSRYSPGLPGGVGDPAHPVPGSELVSGTRDPHPTRRDERSGPHAHHYAPQEESGVGNSKEQIEDSKALSQTPISYLLPPTSYKGAQGLAADVRYYGKWMRDEAEQRIGHLYPKVQVVQEADGSYRHATPAEIQNPKSKIQNLTVIAWLWARTVTCPNPACGATMPLVRSFVLSAKKGKETWVDFRLPSLDFGLLDERPRVRFEVKSKTQNPQSKIPEGTVGRKGARCVCCGAPVSLDHVRAEGRAGRMGAQMLAIVAEGARGRIYLPPSEAHERVAASAEPAWAPEAELVYNPRYLTPPNYGFDTFAKLFTPRQLVALTTFSDLVGEARERVRRDAEAADVGRAGEYADAVATYLAFAIDRLAMTVNSLVRWNPVGEKAQHAFGRQTLSMIWDFADPNLFGSATGSLSAAIDLAADPLSFLGIGLVGTVIQRDAASFVANNVVVSTDPPYYDNVPYADLSDFFYVWLRAALKRVYPELMGTLLVPKAAELVAEPFRHGGREAAQIFFEEGLFKVFDRIRSAQRTDYPLAVYYAFKQAESDSDDDNDATANNPKSKTHNPQSSTGWETMLEGLIQSGFAINGTWPVRTEMPTRMRSLDSNALATSIVLVCRPRPEDARSATRLEFIRALRRELPGALRALQRANIAPVDLAQAAIGPGMAIYSRYKAVLEADGAPMRVRAALQLINAALDEVLAEQEGEYDADTRWAIAWFEQNAFEEGPYGVAETLSKAKNTSVAGMVEAGVVVARGGKVRLISRDELPANWNPATDSRVTAWEATQHLVRALDKGGERGAAAILAALPGAIADQARDLAYRLYTTCERKKWAQEALAYNSLVIAWPEIARLAVELGEGGPVQLGF